MVVETVRELNTGSRGSGMEGIISSLVRAEEAGRGGRARILVMAAARKEVVCL